MSQPKESVKVYTLHLKDRYFVEGCELPDNKNTVSAILHSDHLAIVKELQGHVDLANKYIEDLEHTSAKDESELSTLKEKLSKTIDFIESISQRELDTRNIILRLKLLNEIKEGG